MTLLKRARISGLGWFACFSLVATASGQNPDFPGYLGVYVVEGNNGMRITGFIEDTPAWELADLGGINRGDTIVKLGGRSTQTLSQLRSARNRIPLDQEAKMILRGPQGLYYVWISRSPAVAAMSLPQARSAAPADAGDRITRGGRGEGNEGDFRPKGGAGSAPSAPDDDGGGDFRPKRN